MSASLICFLIWLVYVFLPHRPVAHAISLAKSEMESWDQELRRMVRR